MANILTRKRNAIREAPEAIQSTVRDKLWGPFAGKCTEQDRVGSVRTVANLPSVL